MKSNDVEIWQIFFMWTLISSQNSWNTWNFKRFQINIQNILKFHFKTEYVKVNFSSTKSYLWLSLKKWTHLYFWRAGRRALHHNFFLTKAMVFKDALEVVLKAIHAFCEKIFTSLLWNLHQFENLFPKSKIFFRPKKSGFGKSFKVNL